MSHTKRTPLKFKQYPTHIRAITKEDRLKLNKIKSLISMVLLSANRLNPAQLASLKEAKELAE